VYKIHLQGYYSEVFPTPWARPKRAVFRLEQNATEWTRGGSNRCVNGCLFHTEITENLRKRYISDGILLNTSRGKQ